LAAAGEWPAKYPLSYFPFALTLVVEVALRVARNIAQCTTAPSSRLEDRSRLG
jgi:hypothetical protein